MYHVRLLLLTGLAAVAACTLTPRVGAQGRIKWRYRANAAYIPVRPVLASDGTIYAVDVQQTLHALRADGTTKWTRATMGHRGVDVGKDGTIYTGNDQGITAVNPDGTTKWTYKLTKSAFTLLGPNVGPDGNIYALASDSLGIFSLTPAGKLRWSTPERYSRPIVSYQELQFGPGPRNRGLQMYSNANGRFQRVDCANGNATLISGSSQVQHSVGPNGDVYHSYGNALQAYAPDGTMKWTFGTTPRTGMSSAGIGPDGGIYVVRNVAELNGLDPTTGKSRWAYTDLSLLTQPEVSPTNHIVLCTGRVNFGMDGFLRAVDTRGNLQWQVDLVGATAFTGARFTPDGNTAYVSALDRVNTSGCWLYAIDTSPAPRADVWTYGLGCYGSGGVPLLGFTGRPHLGRTHSIDLSKARPSAPAFHVLGLVPLRIDLTWQGTPGCTLYAMPDLIFPLRTDPTGRASTLLALPNVGALAGLRLFHQFLVSDPSINRAGLVMTNGGGSVIGP